MLDRHKNAARQTLVLLSPRSDVRKGTQLSISTFYRLFFFFHYFHSISIQVNQGMEI